MRGNLIAVWAMIRRRRSIPAYAGEPCTRRSTASKAPVYPRVCGGTSSDPGTADTGRGLSPRMRGNQSGAPTPAETPRSIPAYAGEPPPGAPSPGRGAVYPRVCGGTSDAPDQIPRSLGLSPRMRGNPAAVTAQSGGGRSIPAYAGEPIKSSSWPRATPVYPRVCGGTDNGWSFGGWD